MRTFAAILMTSIALAACGSPEEQMVDYRTEQFRSLDRRMAETIYGYDERTNTCWAYHGLNHSTDMDPVPCTEEVRLQINYARREHLEALRRLR